MKIDRHDQAKILSPDEIKSLFESGLKTARDREALLLTADRALFGVCLYTGARIAEACSLHTKDVYSIDGGIRPCVTIRRGNTKGKSSTRSIPVGTELRVLLENYSSQKVYLFPGRHGRGHIHPDSADKILRAAFLKLRIGRSRCTLITALCLTARFFVLEVIRVTDALNCLPHGLSYILYKDFFKVMFPIFIFGKVGFWDF